MKEDEALPDHLRCKRTDGRQWRCSRRVMDDKKLCEIHYLQGRHRQHKQKVPDSLKLERKPNKLRNSESKPKQSLEIRAIKRERSPEIQKKAKRKRSVGVSEALDETLKKMKLKKGDLQLELIREFLKRQVEKTKAKQIQRYSASELTRQLPNGLMAISPSPLPHAFANAGPCNVKVGLATNPSLQRCFRSKNIEPLPIATMQILPNVAKLRKARRKNCHWCRKSSYRILIKCTSCRKQFFCADCIEERSFDKQEVKMACPVCRGTCSCRACSANLSKDKHKDLSRDKKQADKIQQLYYLIHMLLPLLKQINQDQSIELEIDAKIKGKKCSEVEIQQAELGCKKLHCCSNCRTSIVDFHRSCSNCSYNLCLNCCSELRRGCLPGGVKVFKYRHHNARKACTLDEEQPLKAKKTCTSKKSSRSTHLTSTTLLRNWKACDDGSIPCPPLTFGGCADSILELKCLFPFSWTKELEVSAEEIVCNSDLPETSDVSSCCSLCRGTDHKAKGIKILQGAAKREKSNDNSLYYPSLLDLQDENLEHFQKHWGKGQPVIVRSVLQTSSDLSWDPLVMFCTYLAKSNAKSPNDKVVKTTSCLDWCEVEISTKKIFMGSLEGQTHANMFRETLKLKSWLSSHLFQEQFPAHYAEIIRALPIQEYINPMSGLLNLAVKLPQEMPKSDIGPCIYISYGGSEELMQSDFLTKLCYDPYDVVNILAHTTAVPVSREQLIEIKSSLKKYKAPNHRESTRTATDQKMVNEMTGKPSFCIEAAEESGLLYMTGEGIHLPNGIAKVCSNSGESQRGRASSIGDRIVPHTNECASEFDAEVSILCSGAIENYEDSDDENIFWDDMESSSSHGEKIEADSCGAQWDIFRRQDVPNLLEYLRKYSNELSQAYCFPKHVVHPILDQTFFLDPFHKMRLKEEFNIEPWTFEQHPGEAVIIPAGCPYQIRKLKSCVNVVLEFISPESATECIKLTDELRLLPVHHKAREKLLEVKKRTLYGISTAIEEILTLTHPE